MRIMRILMPFCKLMGNLGDTQLYKERSFFMLVRKLTNVDREKVMSFLNKDQLSNIGAISNIRLFGLDGNEYTSYGEFDDDVLVSYLGKYKSLGVSYYSQEKRDISEMAKVINGLEWKHFSGCQELIQQFEPFIEHQKKYEQFFSVTKDYDYFELDGSIVKTMTTEEELKELMTLMFQIEEFEETREFSKEEVISEMSENYFKLKDGLLVYLRKENQIVAMAGSMLENDEYAYLHSVATLESERKKGYASIVVMHLMNEYKKMNKRLCLQYDNPEAAKIYHRLGFVDQDKKLTLVR